MKPSPASSRRRVPARAWLGLAVGAALLGCGGGGNPLSNPPLVANPPGQGGQKLSFRYFQECINPIFLAQLQVNQGGQISTNTCAGSGCHRDGVGAGGAFRVVPDAAEVDLSLPANDADTVRLSDMYKNFYSAQGEVVFGSAAQSRLINKPLVRGVLHGGGLIFEDDNDPNVRLIRYWISRPVPVGQDEFSTAGNNMFTPPLPVSGRRDLNEACNTE
jgi:hypothetical protein